MSTHFKLCISGLLAFCLLLFWVYRKGEQHIRASEINYKLPSNTIEQLHIDEKKHTISITTQTGTKTEYARNPTITENKNGTLTVDRHILGLDHDIFFGGGYADCTRLFLGVDGFHIYRTDLFGAIGIANAVSNGFVRPYFGLGYNFYANTSVNFGINPTQLTNPGIFVSVKF